MKNQTYTRPLSVKGLRTTHTDRIVIFALSVLVLIVASACNNRQTSSVPVPVVKTIKPELSKEQPGVDSFGSISFKQKTDLSAGIDGVVERVFVDESSFVQEGQELLQLRNAQLDTRFEQANSDIRSANASYRQAITRLEDTKLQLEGRFFSLEKLRLSLEQKERELVRVRKVLADKRELHDLQGVSDDELASVILQEQQASTEYTGMKLDADLQSIGFRDEDLKRVYGKVPEDPSARKMLFVELNARSAQSDVDLAAAKRDAAKAELSSVELLRKDLSVRASYTAIVGARYVHPGERVQTGTKLLTVFGNNEVYAVFPVQESTLSELREGQSVEVIVPSLGNHQYKTVLRSIAPTVDPQSGNLQLRVNLANTDRRLRPGMFVRTRVSTGNEKPVIRIPLSCLAGKTDKTATIFEFKNGRAFSLTLETGVQEGDAIRIARDMPEGVALIDRPPPLLRDGMEVRLE